MAEHELAIFFNMETSSRRKYAADAWNAFMTNCNPELLRKSKLYHGEVSGLLPGSGQVFCIAVKNSDPDIIHYLKDVFAACDDERLAPPVDRVREADVTQKHALEYRGAVDAQGRLETPEWNRADHDMCKATGWPYVPIEKPEHIKPEILEELEDMGKPGLRVTDAPTEKPGSRRVLPFGIRLGTGEIKRKAAFFAAVAIVVGLIAFFFLTGDKSLSYISELSKYGIEGAGKRAQGYAIASITEPPRDLDLDALNRKLAQRAYYVMELKDESLLDVWLDCTVWFSPNETRDPLLTTTVQAFIKITMRSLDDRPLWLSQGNASRSAPGAESENQQLRKDALLAAIQNIDFSCLPDGISVKSFQANRDFEGLRNHAVELARQAHPQPEASSAPSAVEGEVSAAPPQTVSTLSEHDLVRKRLCNFLTDKWVMTHNVRLVSGGELAVVILEETDEAFKMRADTGTLSIGKQQIEKIEPLSRIQIAGNIDGMLEPVKKKFNHEWEYLVCNKLVKELSRQYTTYGVPLPGICTVRLRKNGQTGRMKAIVKGEEGRTELRSGDKIDGFNVIGIDPGTQTVAVRMGEGGDILRIWPKRTFAKN
jgi:hypothetical protein